MTPIDLPLPTIESVAWALLFVLSGMTVPTAFGIERLNGFGRWALSHLPYLPPPGVEEADALEAAADGPGDGQGGDS